MTTNCTNFTKSKKTKESTNYKSPEVIKNHRSKKVCPQISQISQISQLKITVGKIHELL